LSAGGLLGIQLLELVELPRQLAPPLRATPKKACEKVKIAREVGVGMSVVQRVLSRFRLTRHSPIGRCHSHAWKRPGSEAFSLACGMAFEGGIMNPYVVGLVALGLWAAYRIDVERGRELEQEATTLWTLSQQERDPERRKRLALAWNRAASGSWRMKRLVDPALTKTATVDAWGRGAEARAAGEPVSANPHRSRFWGSGRRWRKGWKYVDEYPDLIETFRRTSEERDARPR